MASLSHTLEYYSLVSIAWVLNALPRKMALGVGASVGELGWLLRIRRSLVLANLKQALPNTDERKRKRIAARAARNFGRTATEFIRTSNSDRNRLANLIHVDGKKQILEALEKGNGALLLTGHFGAWATYFAALAMNEKVPLALLVGKQHNERVDQFIHGLSAGEVELISKGRSAIRKILANIKAGRAVIIVADQHPGKSGIMTPFLGRETPTLALPSSFAVKHNIPVFTLTGHREKTGTHRIVIKALKTEPCETDEQRKKNILSAYNEVLGKAIKQHPDQYFWYHRRWRDADFLESV